VFIVRLKNWPAPGFVDNRLSIGKARVVVAPKGIIVSMRDRRYFEQF
jgi:hypothetical protein